MMVTVMRMMMMGWLAGGDAGCRDGRVFKCRADNKAVTVGPSS